MQKLDGRICDSCRKLFYPGDTIYEVCPMCFHSVWCVTNIYKDGSKELSSIHHTEEHAKAWIEKSKNLIESHNTDNPIIDQVIDNWCVF